MSSRLTANLGLRFDKNDGVNSAGDVVSRDSAWSPRLGVVWDPTGGERWSLSGSFARYVSGLSNNIANTGSAGGNSDTYPYVYQGPSINANGVAEVPTAEAIRQVFEWFNANGGTNRPLNGGAYGIPIVVVGTTPVIRDSLMSPNALEYAAGLSRRLGSRATVRADVIYRDYHDFYAWRTDTHDRRRGRQAGPAVRPHAGREHGSAQTAVRRPEHAGHLPGGTGVGCGRDLHVIADVGELRR